MALLYENTKTWDRNTPYEVVRGAAGPERGGSGHSGRIRLRCWAVGISFMRWGVLLDQREMDGDEWGHMVTLLGGGNTLYEVGAGGTAGSERSGWR